MLKVLLKTARATGACWIGAFGVGATASDVLADFCRTYHLNRESCALFYVEGGKLAPKQLLRKIRKVPAHTFIQLTVAVQEPTLSFLLGSKWMNININAPTGSDRQALSKVWYDIAMAHSSATTYAATAMSDMDTLLNLIQCKHTDILPASVAQPNLEAAAVGTASAASQPLVLLIHALGTVAASRQQQAALHPGLCNVRLEAEMKHLAVQSSQDKPSKDNAINLDHSAMTALLRCAILLLKLVDLTPAGVATDGLAALWLTIFCLLTRFQENMHSDLASDSVNDQPPGSASEQQQLTRVLVQLILRMLQHSQGILQSGATICFQLLACLVGTPATQPTALPAMCTKDGMALIAKGLVQAKLHAAAVGHLIFNILSAKLTTESRDATLKVIADMQGVRRLSNLLCPTLDNTLEYDIRCASLVYKSKSVTYKSPADTDPDLAILLPIPLLMGALLYARPYSSQSPALQTCLPTLLAVISPDRTATHAGIHTTLDNPHPSQHSYTSTQQQQQLGQRDGPAQVIASLVDQQSSHAAEDPDLPCGPQPPGGSHPPDGPHPPGDPNPHGGPQPGAPVPASPQATSVYRGQQTTGTSRNEVANSVSPTQCASSTGAGIDPEVLCSNILCATPSESVWANIETVALRVLVTLHWAIQGNTKLMQCLAGTAHALLVGHVMDPQLDMSKVLKFGLPAVLKALPQIESQLIHTLSTTCLRHLACLFLRRVATDRHAFLALYGKCTQNLNGVSLIGRVKSGPAIEALWCLLGGYDVTAESDAYPSLLQAYVEAAYLLPQHADPADRSTTSEVEGSSSRQLPANSEAAGSLKLLYEAMLPSQPLHTRLTSCACLLRHWIDGTANPQSVVPSNTNGSIASDFCDCLEAGLQAAVGLVTSVEEQEDCPKLTLQKLGLARALLAAGTALPHLYQQEPQQTVGLVQLTIELLRVGHLQTSSHDLQEQLLRACVLFLDEAYHLRPECTQGPLHYADAMAEATTYWSKVWTEQDPTPCGYVDVGLTECQPDSMCAELVQRIVHLKGADGIERDRSLQTAVVSSMCWLHTAAKSRYDGFTPTLNSWRYKGLVQALAMIPMCTQLGEQASVEVPGWTHDVPSQTSCALLQLLCIHVIHLSEAANVVLKSGTSPGEVSAETPEAGASGLQNCHSEGLRGPLASACKTAKHLQPQQAADVAAYTRAVVRHLLEGLEHIRGHPVWGEALACLDDDSWCPRFILLGEFRKTLAMVAANRMLDDKSLQQLQKAFPALVTKVEAASEHEQQLQWAMMSPDSAAWEAMEAAASKAAEQLLAEEDQKATKAAAKQAKKLRQKLRKQQQANGSQLRAEAQGLEADVDASLQDSAAQAAPEHSTDTSAAQHSMTQPSAAEDQVPQSATPQHSAVPWSGCVNAQTEHEVAPLTASPLLSNPLSSSHDLVCAEPDGGSLGAIHKLLCCPITKVMMMDPVIAADGHTYERAALQDWLQHSAVSPVDKTPLKHTRLVTNLAIKNAVAFQGQHM